MLNDDDEEMIDNLLMRPEDNLPDNLYILPLQGRPIFPGIFTPMVINSQEDCKVV